MSIGWRINRFDWNSVDHKNAFWEKIKNKKRMKMTKDAFIKNKHLFNTKFWGFSDVFSKGGEQNLAYNLKKVSALYSQCRAVLQKSKKSLKFYWKAKAFQRYLSELKKRKKNY